MAQLCSPDDLTPAQLTQAWELFKVARIHPDGDQELSLTALEGEQVVGAVASALTNAVDGMEYSMTIAVTPLFQSKGIGRQLVDSCLAELQSTAGDIETAIDASITCVNPIMLHMLGRRGFDVEALNPAGMGHAYKRFGLAAPLEVDEAVLKGGHASTDWEWVHRALGHSGFEVSNAVAAGDVEEDAGTSDTRYWSLAGVCGPPSYLALTRLKRGWIGTLHDAKNQRGGTDSSVSELIRILCQGLRVAPEVIEAAKLFKAYCAEHTPPVSGPSGHDSFIYPGVTTGRRVLDRTVESVTSTGTDRLLEVVSKGGYATEFDLLVAALTRAGMTGIWTETTRPGCYLVSGVVGGVRMDIEYDRPALGADFAFPLFAWARWKSARGGECERQFVGGDIIDLLEDAYARLHQSMSSDASEEFSRAIEVMRQSPDVLKACKALCAKLHPDAVSEAVIRGGYSAKYPECYQQLEALLTAAGFNRTWQAVYPNRYTSTWTVKDEVGNNTILLLIVHERVRQIVEPEFCVSILGIESSANSDVYATSPEVGKAITKAWRSYMTQRGGKNLTDRAERFDAAVKVLKDSTGLPRAEKTIQQSLVTEAVLRGGYNCPMYDDLNTKLRSAGFEPEDTNRPCDDVQDHWTGQWVYVAGNGINILLELMATPLREGYGEDAVYERDWRVAVAVGTSLEIARRRGKWERPDTDWESPFSAMRNVLRNVGYSRYLTAAAVRACGEAYSSVLDLYGPQEQE
jgi:GNAT superfamily N-acetyltransferase